MLPALETDHSFAQKGNKKTFKRIEVPVMERVLSTIYESGRQNRTNIATNSKLAYNKCVRYIGFLEMIDFVRECRDSSSVVFELTPHGISFCKRKLSEAFCENPSEIPPSYHLYKRFAPRSDTA